MCDVTNGCILHMLFGKKQKTDVMKLVLVDPMGPPEKTGVTFNDKDLPLEEINPSEEELEVRAQLNITILKMMMVDNSSCRCTL